MNSRIANLIRQRESVQTQLSEKTKEKKKLAQQAKRLWKTCREVEKELNAAFENMRNVAGQQESLFDEYVRIKNQNDAQIDRLQDGEDKTKLIGEISSAEARWRDYRGDVFMPTRDQFRTLHQRYLNMKAEHAELSEKLNAIRSDIGALIVQRGDLTRLVVLEQFLTDSERHREVLAKCFGLTVYADSIKVKVGMPGGYNIYYGQKTTPSDHGHIVVGPTGKIIYSRLPGSPKGRSNFKGPTGSTTKKGRYQKPVARLMSCTSALSLAVGQV